jgi:ABC-type antimicrobial peptide transport system permease subunit
MDGDRLGAGRVAIVNETMAHRFWPYGGAIGKCIRIGRSSAAPCSEIVGVAEDVRRNRITEQPTMQYYVPLDQTDATFFLPITALLVRTKGPAATRVGAVRSAVQSVSSELPYVTVQTMSELYVWQLQRWQIGSTVLGLVGTLALVLASVGLYGVVSYYVAGRTHEIGVRMALGADRRHILVLVLRRGLLVSLGGLLLGALASRFVARYWAGIVYAVSPTDTLALIEAAALLLVVASLACYGPAMRATRVVPTVALKSE